MRFEYAIIDYDYINIELEDIYESIKEYLKEHNKESDSDSICSEFINSLEYWIHNLYGANDFVEDDNTYEVDTLLSKWCKFCNNVV